MSGAAYEDVWAESADGLRLHGRRYGPAAAEALPIVCLPGLARTAADFDRLTAALAADAPARTILALDYRGRGRSDYDPEPAHYTVPVEAADTAAFLTAQGIGRAVFVGTSRGGLITMALAAGMPKLVAGAVLNDIGPVLDLAGLLRIKGYVGRLGSPADLAAGGAALRDLFSPHFPLLTAEEWQDWASGTWTLRDGALVLDYDPALSTTLDAITPETALPDLWPLFKALHAAPLLVVRGAHSDLLSAETLARMAEEHPDCETLTVADEGHTPLLHRPAPLAAIRRLVARAAVAPVLDEA